MMLLVEIAEHVEAVGEIQNGLMQQACYHVVLGVTSQDEGGGENGAWASTRSAVALQLPPTAAAVPLPPPTMLRNK